MTTTVIETRKSPYATVSEAAGYTRLSERTIRRAIARERLAVCRVGSRVLVRYEDLDAFVAAGG